MRQVLDGVTEIPIAYVTAYAAVVQLSVSCFLSAFSPVAPTVTSLYD